MSFSPARQEWAGMWPLPLLATLGIAGSATFGYSSGVFLGAMTGEFGWSRSQFSAAFAVQMVVGLIAGPLTGRLVDRIGPRRVGLTGILLYVGGLSSMGLANGALWQWCLLGAVQAVCTCFIASPVWLGAVVPRFHVSRGFALAVSLAGIGVAQAVWPILAAVGIQSFGWRATFPMLALGWAVLALPFAWFWLIDPPARPTADAAREPTEAKIGYGAALRSRTFVCVTLAGAIFAGVCYGLILHLVPMLHERGLSLAQAAGLAGIMGLFVIGGRLATGYLLDRLPTRPLGIVIFLLPVVVCLLLWLGAGNQVATLAAVAVLGIATGSETDVVVFIIAGRFDRRIFASIFAVVLAVFALFAASGPLIAGGLYDHYGSYVPYLMISIPASLLAVLFIALVPRATVSRGSH